MDLNAIKDVSPMMQHYLETKEKYKDCILFYRLGDFYEMFFEDAETASRELELTLTGKSCGLEERAPMCGVPYHAVENYINRLVSKGYKVAICEQLEDPKLAKGIVKRDVIRIVTPGTNTNVFSMDESENCYIMCIVYMADRFGISIADVTTGDYYVTQLDSDRKLLDEISRFSPREIICNEPFFMSGIDIDGLRSRYHISVNSAPTGYFDDRNASDTLKKHFKVQSLEGLGLRDLDIGTVAAGALMEYLIETQKNELLNITKITPYSTTKSVIIDSSTRRNLELTETMREKQKRGSLLWVLDKTKTAMGARTLRKFIEQPLIDRAMIEKRLDSVAELSERVSDRDEIREYLDAVYDLERLLCRVSYGSASPRDLIALKSSLAMLTPIKNLLSDFNTALLRELCNSIDTMDDIRGLIEKAIVEEPPLLSREGGIIREGYDETVDKLRKAKTDGKTWLAELEAKTKESTGIRTLKIKYNKVFGYYFEVSNSFISMVPENFIRKQTLTNGERYTTDELKKMEDMILNAEDRLYSLEYDIFTEVRDEISRGIKLPS